MPARCYATENCDADWAEEAVKRAAFILEYSGQSLTKDAMDYQLVNFYGFSEAEAIYGVEQNGFK